MVEDHLTALVGATDAKPQVNLIGVVALHVGNNYGDIFGHVELIVTLLMVGLVYMILQMIVVMMLVTNRVIIIILEMVGVIVQRGLELLGVQNNVVVIVWGV